MQSVVSHTSGTIWVSGTINSLSRQWIAMAIDSRLEHPTWHSPDLLQKRIYSSSAKPSFEQFRLSSPSLQGVIGTFFGTTTTSSSSGFALRVSGMM